MYQIDDRVVYANYGVCIVAETNVRKTMAGEEHEYYVLNATRDRGGKVYVPMDREELLRPVMSREDVLRLIDAFGDLPVDDFKDSNSRTVEDHFRKLLRDNSCANALLVAKTMRRRIAEQEAKRHIPSSMYTRLYDQATRQVRSEFAAALGISEDDIDRLMKENDLAPLQS